MVSEMNQLIRIKNYNILNILFIFKKKFYNFYAIFFHLISFWVSLRMRSSF